MMSILNNVKQFGKDTIKAVTNPLDLQSVSGFGKQVDKGIANANTNAMAKRTAPRIKLFDKGASIGKAYFMNHVRKKAKQTRRSDPIGYLFNPKRMGPLTEMVAGIGRRHYANKTSWHDKTSGRKSNTDKDSLKQRLLAIPAMIRAANRRKK